jgi:hypothetical protein
MWIVGSRRLYEAGSRRRGVWLGASLCPSVCFCSSFYLDLELCARGTGWCRGLPGEGKFRRWLARTVVYEDWRKIEVEPAQGIEKN